jgi:3-dehydroquinate dehydratase-2
MKNIFLISGPNLNLLDKRESDHYPSIKLSEVVNKCTEYGKTHNLKIKHFQSNHEGEIIDKIQEIINQNNFDAIMINAGAYTHTSIAILDALNIYNGKVIELHFSDISKREDFRKTSYISFRADKVFKGEGLQSYIQAIDFLRGL